MTAGVFGIDPPHRRESGDHRSGIRGAAAEPRAVRDALLQHDAHGGLALERRSHRLGSAIREIVPRLRSDVGIALDGEPIRGLHPDAVRKLERVEDAHEFVVAVSAASADRKMKVDLRGRGYAQHASPKRTSADPCGPRSVSTGCRFLAS